MLFKINSFEANELSYTELYGYLLHLEADLNRIGEYNFIKRDPITNKFFSKYPNNTWIDDYRNQIRLLTKIPYFFRLFEEKKIYIEELLEVIFDLYPEYCVYTMSISNLFSRVFLIVAESLFVIEENKIKLDFTQEEYEVFNNFLYMIYVISH